ncbi:MAG: ornithine cyclodeaminase family protein [Deltaproteobacteria bacterium]|nr:MAG: ornithine cyclodeaminase family protein [Deltaproteobacteria bacterium]
MISVSQEQFAGQSVLTMSSRIDIPATMLILSNEEIESFLSINTCIDALQKAYGSWDKGTAINRPRTDLVLPSSNEAGVYAFKSMEAGLYDPPIVAMRINSDIIRWNQKGDRTIKTKIPAAPGDKYVGLVMLFSTITGEPLAMFPDGVVQRMRVASSSAIAARYLAREDASTMALFGSGWQAGSHLPAMCAVRPIKRVNVFSPTKANLDAFVKELQPKVSAEVRAAESPEATVRNADIIATTTNSLTRVVNPDWVKPGLHLTCVRVPELGDETIRRIDRLVIHAHQHAPKNYVAGYGEEGIEAHDAIDIIRKGPAHVREVKVEHPFWLSAPALKELVTGKVPGRASADESTCFLNNIGIGLQFAAVGAAVFNEAKAKGVGHEIPTDWFLESVHP